ncbi:bifunctional glycosyltransferase/CDP-glycerol:glycerophosphate glycerophosphotransferase [Streptomyces lancefieldiae]|uniref:Bifunctional glycosyltransferase family 2 protein/CDP-glycerol:glycerophosphate glycerophosphotransferase n=1 Tax=Streptomyces lancefieldiae TaxID=3075520 RepID=A0ABU3AW89_9ACTN|nr:bifunctional glycosyltransferase family 2 protein/CDP-glycerol:glycerophosphate glycerophosphotransferase [Streptomyces sp. DSM 40712]MDT0613081.1 bifunctional glycosyltransferase family 2 protein/CDP-glycerol:glycerophosphate glycerophosphotransferase [Streptomyces sp. DSM 40712]
MPRFSVIVPAYQVQAYLHACLESVLSQSCPDLELIVVDDCSPDACGAIADEFAARDPRVRPVHLPRNQGLGPARNAGMERASGDYLVFLDGDDTLAPHALRAIADRIKETGEPDVLVYDYARTYWTGETVRNRAAAHLSERGPAPFRLADRPGLLKLLMVAWNKTVRREFAERAGFTFPPGYYEDTPWTYPVLMTAGSIATLDRVCVHYRQRRRGSILGTPSARHLDVFTQYDRVFAYLESYPELARWRPVLFRRMADHLTTVFTRPDRLPRSLRAEFLRRARVHCRRYRVPGAPAPLPVRLRHALLRLGLRRTYEALRLASALRRRTGKAAAKLLRAARSAALRLHYRVQRRLPLRADRAVFAADGGRGHGCNPGALEDAFRTFAPHVRTAWAAAPEHHHAVPPGPRRLTPGTAAYWTALARSRYLVHNTAFDPGLVKRRGQVLIQTQAGTPLAYTGLDLQERPAAARDTDFTRMLRDVDSWDYVVSANRHSTLTWERVHPGGYTVLEYGQPRTDVFHRATAADVARLRESLGIPEGTVAILYAPAHRDYRRTQRVALDLERVVTHLGPRFMVLARAAPEHSGCAGPLVASGGRVLDVSDHPSVESLCLASDALVTDYSALVFDYAGLDRPIVLHADEPEAYEAARGTYVDLHAFPPGAVVRDEDELIDVFAGGHWRGSRSARLRAAFRERFCPHDDGRAAERVVRRVVLGEKDLPPVVPLAERRPAPSSPTLDPARTGGPPSAALARTPLATVPQPAGPRTVTDSF